MVTVLDIIDKGYRNNWSASVRSSLKRHLPFGCSK